MSIISALGDAILYDADYAILNQTGSWFTDHNILFWQQYMELERFRQDNSTFTMLQPAAAFSIEYLDIEDLMVDTHDNVFRQLASKQLILIPVVDGADAEEGGGHHWVLLVYLKSDPNILYVLDSSRGSSNAMAQLNIIGKKLVEIVQGAPPTHLRLVFVTCPQQRNNFDCGVHVCMNAYRIVETFLENASVSLNSLNFLTDAYEFRKLMLSIADIHKRTT